MEAEKSKQAAEIQTFNDYRDPESPSSADYNASNVLNFQIISPHRRRMRKSYAKHRHRFKHVPCDLSTYFKQRKMSKIQEEIYHSKHSENPFKEKAYKEKAASLKTIVQRLNQMCLAKPEVLQNKLPEEITKLFSDIEI